MDELIDILDEKGNYTGKSCLKSVAHKKGHFHPTVHIWLYTNDHKILLQKRALTKKVFPGLWDISVAGHITAGENIENAAVREITEEIGFTISKKELQKIGTRKHMINHPNGIMDNEFHHVFIAELTVTIQELKVQKEEVDELKLFELNTLINTKSFDNVLLPQYHDYYTFVYHSILENL